MADARAVETGSAPQPRRFPRVTVIISAATVGTSVAVGWSMVAFSKGPVSAGTNAALLASSALLCAGAIAVLRGNWWSVAHRVRIMSLVLLLVIPSVYAVGYMTQLTVENADGNTKPVLGVSDRADAAAQVVELRTSLDTLISADELLVLTNDQARVRLDDIADVSALASQIVKDFGGTRTWTNPDMAAAATAVAQAADIAVLALNDKASLAQTSDPMLQDRITARRSDLLSYALAAGNFLRIAAATAGVSNVLRAPVAE